MLIDTHAHLNFSAFDKDRNILIEKCLKNNIWMINVGSKYETSKKAVEIAKKYKEGVYAAIGLHPIHLATGLMKIKTDPEEGDFLAKGEDFDEKKYKELAHSTRASSEQVRPELTAEGLSRISSGQSCSKVVAIGEIGLDYYYRPKTKIKLELFKEKQRTVLCQQLELAKELSLPVIFHCRMAHEDLIEILNYKLKTINYKLKGVIHGFVGTLEQLQEYLKMGFYIGFNGIIFKEIEGINFKENIKKTPLQRILIETDCPYLIPPLARRSFAVKRNEGGPEQLDRNEPIFVKYIAQEIAKIKNLDYQKVAEITTENAIKLFNL